MIAANLPRWKLIAYILFMRGFTFRQAGNRTGKTVRQAEQAFRDVCKAFKERAR